MKYLLLFLVIPFSVAHAAAPDCNALKKIAGDLEKQIQSTHFKDPETCTKLEPKDLGLPKDSIGFGGDWDYRCKDVSAIDLQLKSIENEIALLKGIEVLQSEINTGLDTIKKFKNPNMAKKASTTFIQNLNVAISLEQFLGTNNSDSENILSKVAQDPAGWTDIKSFAGLLEKHCKFFSSKGDSVCRKDFELSKETYREISEFIKVGKGTERKFDKKQIEDLTDALAIKKGEEAYSYKQLGEAIKGPVDGVLAQEDLALIKELPPLSNRTKYSFLKNLKDSAKDLKSSEKLIHAQATPARFSSIVQDLKKRQEWEMKSKVSLVLDQYKTHLPEDVQEVCSKARELNGSIEDCLSPLKKSKELQSFQKSAVDDLIAELKYGQNHLTKMDELLKDCVPGQDLVYPSKCDEMVTQQLADLVAKSQMLNALKAKHVQSTPDLISFRNFALEKLHSNECMKSEESNLNCSFDLGEISVNSIVLSKNVNDIIYVFENPLEGTEIGHLCLESEEVVPFKEKLCELLKEDPKKTSNNNDEYEAPVSPDSGNTTGKALVDLGSSILNSIAGYLAPPQNQINPYGPVFPYSQPMAQPRDISSQIMDPYVSRGYGNYSPTQGLRPYSSISSNVGTSSAYDFGGAKFFNSPVGW
jgi:hypothetical protein